MTVTIIDWPDLLYPAQMKPNIVPFTRSGGPTLGGIETPVRTDRGWWAVDYIDVPLHSRDRRQVWNAIRVSLGGRAGLVRVPVRGDESAPFVGGIFRRSTTAWDDGTTWDDGTEWYEGAAIEIRMHALAAIGDTVVQIRRVFGGDNLSGFRFSYNSALYEVGLPSAISEDGDVWTVPVFPALRAAIPANALLECERPTCIMRLAADRGMDLDISTPSVDRASVSFVEAADYWNALAAEG